ncbi:MAG TPA: glycoside hydrolase family 27 protein [Lachnospiraceae bacterium]|nr:glycoside hydrolase family 27 protein [Lachnospiraceae bacterium]
MKKDNFAITPPMGWNSYDYYDTTVTENQVKENANFMATHLKESGWEYIVVDIQWYSYDAGSDRENFQYIPFGKVEMDEYSRLLPCPDRFPSSAGGQGFKPLADYIHNLGLKFGIHIMRGIPRIAAHNHTKILGTDKTANQIAEPSNICMWNPDMYGVDTKKEESQLYYNSIIQLYADWGVDFIKCDDICRMDTNTCKKEIEMLHHAIRLCNRDIVLSLSPGPADIGEAFHYETYSNMWRITDDFWDAWPFLLGMFRRCEIWQGHGREGCWPDCDMLPLGKIGKAFGSERDTRFTKVEQITMMNLWCIFRSPLMLGSEMTKLDDWTLHLLTNAHLISCLNNGSNPRQLFRDHEKAAWISKDTVMNCFCLALFNLSEDDRIIEVASTLLEEFKVPNITSIREAWEYEIERLDRMDKEGNIKMNLPAHGSAFLLIN